MSINWYAPLEDKILSWRNWRKTISQDPLTAATEIQQFWLASPWKLQSKYTDDIKMWPDAWKIFDNISYCDFLRGLGMFYTLCVCPQFAQHIIKLETRYTQCGDRLTLPVIDDVVLNFNEVGVIPASRISNEYQKGLVYTPEDFSFLKL